MNQRGEAKQVASDRTPSAIRFRLGMICLVCFLMGLLACWPDGREASGHQIRFIPIRDPRTYASPSGEYALYVDPDNPEGHGSATYRLTRRGTVVWEGKRPFAFWEAAVTDSGVAVGYSYSKGVYGVQGKGNAYGLFEIVILDGAGRTRLDQKIKRAPAGLHAPPSPSAEGLLLDPAHDLMIVRMVDGQEFRRDESWWIYQLSTGHKIRQFAPLQQIGKRGNEGYVADARHIAGTGAFLVQCNGIPDSSDLPRFTLIDQEGKPLWRFDIAAELAKSSSTRAQDRVKGDREIEDAILKSDQPGRFTIGVAALNREITFAVAPDGATNVRVAAIDRVAYPPPAQTTMQFVAPDLNLTLHDKVDLVAPGLQAQPPIRSVFDPVSAGPHHLAFLRRDRREDLVVVSDEGHILYAVSLDSIALKEDESISALLWRGGTRFLVFVERRPKQPQVQTTEAYEVEARMGLVAKLEGFRSNSVKSVAALIDGGFVVLSTDDSFQAAIHAYNPQGRPTWAVTEQNSSGSKDRPGGLFSPEALTVLRDGSVAVLDVIAHTVQFYSPHGQYIRTISLDRAWHREAQYPSGIFADPSGGFIVHDYPATPAVYRMSVRGDVLNKCTPQYADGKRMDLPSLAVTPDGNLWASDQYSLLLLNANGRAIKRVGEAPHADQLHKIVELAIRPDGEMLAADERTNAVHVFSARGNWLHVCIAHRNGQESPEMFRSVTREIDLGPDGSFAIAGVWFDSRGDRRTKPVGYQAIRDRLAHIQRRPDRTWLEYVHGYAVAPDGSLAIVDDGEKAGDNRTFLSLFPANRGTGRVIPLPDEAGSYPEIATDGKRIVLAENQHVYCYLTSGQPLWRASLPVQKDNAVWTPYLTEGGKTLCLFDGEHSVYRYTMP